MDLSQVGQRNYAYSSAELHIIRQACVAAEKTILHTQDEIAKLGREEEELIEKVRRYRVALAPHNRLPVDVLRFIFKLCCLEPARIPATMRGVYAISRVCSTWRRIALAAPELWDQITINLSAQNGRKIRTAREWLSRACKLPCSLTLHFEEHLTVCDAWGLNVVLNLVAHYPIRHLTLDLRPEQLQLLAKLPHSWFNHPENIEIQCSDTDVSLTGTLIPPDVTLAKLKSLDLTGDWDYCDLVFSVPWTQLRYLHLEISVLISQCLVMLRQCTNVEDCLVMVIPDDPDAELQSITETIRMEKVVHLTLYFDTEDGPHVETVIRLLALPNIKALKLRWDPGSRLLLNTDTVQQLIQRSDGAPNLRLVDICCTTSPLDLGVLLPYMKQLKHLNIVNGDLDYDTMYELSMGKLGKRLELLQTASRHDAEQVLRMVALRQQNASMGYPSLGRFNNVFARFKCVESHCFSVSKKREAELNARREALERSSKDLAVTLTF